MGSTPITASSGAPCRPSAAGCAATASPSPASYRERRELAEQAHQLASEVGLRQAARQLGVHRDALTAAFTQWDLPAPERRVGWQPSRFLTDRAEAERAFALAEQLGSVNAAAAELGTTWPSLRKAFTRHGLGMPARNPEAVRQRAIAAARQRTGQPATPTLDPVFVALNPGALPARERSPAELYEWVRREEQYATLGANVVVELYSESHARQPTTRAWAIIRRADRSHRLAGQRASRAERRHADRCRPHQPIPATPGAGDGGRCPLTPPARPAGQRAAVPRLLCSLMSLFMAQGTAGL